MAKGIFVTGTGTDVGKTYVTALIVKKLADALVRKGYLTVKAGANNAVSLEETEKVAAYSAQMAQRRECLMRKLFAAFSEEELAEFYRLHRKLYAGIAGVEEYAAQLESEGNK